MHSATPHRRYLAAVAALVLCASAQPAAAQVQLADCGGFTEVTRIPVVTIFPDTNMLGYQGLYWAGPAHETVIRGRTPGARWWQFAVLDQSRSEVDEISDADVVTAPDGSYEVVVRLDCDGAPNCLEVGDAVAPGSPWQLWMRMYVPDGDETGGVGLPTIEYRSFDGEPVRLPITEDRCRELLADATTPTHPGHSVHDTLSEPSGLEQPVCQPGDPPDPFRFEIKTILQWAGVPDEAIDLVREIRGDDPFAGVSRVSATAAILYDLTQGNLHVRAKAPTFRAQHGEIGTTYRQVVPTTEDVEVRNAAGVDDGSEQVRYWSLCTTQEDRPVDCLRDENAVLDENGFYDVIVSPECPVAGYANCLRGGVTSAAGLGGLPILALRNHVPSAAFFSPFGPDECPPYDSAYCGPYEPIARYVPRDCEGE